MTFQARVIDGVVSEPPVELPDGKTPADIWPPSIASAFVACGVEVQAGWTYDAGKGFKAPVPPAVTKDALVGYANDLQWQLAIGGFVVTIAGAPVGFLTDPTSLALINGKATRLGQANPPATIEWQQSATTFVTIAAADFMTAACTVADFVQATFDTLKTVLADIASGKIKTLADVDAAAWPSAHP